MTSHPDQLTVVVTEPGGGPVDISARISKLSFGTNEHGDADCSFIINDPYPHDTALFRAGARISITDDAGAVYVGRIEVPGGSYITDFGEIRHLARGYASSADDRIYAGTKQWGENYSIEAIFREVLSDLCADIAEGDIDAGDRTLPETSQDFLFGSASFIWNTVAPLGGDAIPLLWRVFADSAGTPRLYVNPRPTAVTLYTSMGAGNFFSGDPVAGGTQVSVNGDLRQVYNAVAVKVASGNNAPGCACITVHDSGSQGTGVGGVGTMRMLGLDLSSIPGIEVIDATRAANMMLSQTSSLRAVGTELTLHYPQTVLGGGSAQQPLWRVRAGQIIKVVDLESGDTLIGNEFFISGTRWHEEARRLSIQIGQRNGLAEAVGRSIRARRPGRPDSTVSDPIPEIAREPRRGTVYDVVQHPGGTNRDVPYAPGDHSHGTVNGDIALTYGLDGVGAAIELPAITAMGLIRGTMLTWKIRCNVGGLIKYRLSFPEGFLILPGLEDPIHLPGGVVFAEGSNGSTGSINLECLTNSEVDVEVQGVPTATWASLILTGTRNLIFSDPLTPLESGTGAVGNGIEGLPLGV